MENVPITDREAPTEGIYILVGIEPLTSWFIYIHLCKDRAREKVGEEEAPTAGEFLSYIRDLLLEGL